MSWFSKTIFSIFSIGALALGFVSSSFFEKTNERTFAKIKMGETQIAAQVADDPTERAKGLAGRATIADFEGMLFVFERPGYYGFWMKGMHFPIDIFWIKNGKIADLVENVPPPIPNTAKRDLVVYKPDIPAKLVLETKAGFASRYGLKIGDPVEIEFTDTFPILDINSLAFSLGSLKQMNKGDNRKSIVDSSSLASKYFIDTLRRNMPFGKNFKVGDLLAKHNRYATWQISYESDNLSISGVMNVPNSPVPKTGFPVLILNHGLINKKIYYSGRGSRREQEFFTTNGYITIHPDYRGYASSSPDPAKHYDFYTGYTKDVLGLLDAIEEADLPYMDLNRIGMWGHSTGGGVALRIMVLRPEVKAFVLFAPNSSYVEDDFYELPASEIKWIRQTFGPPGADVFAKMSAQTYFADVSVPVQLHHGTKDNWVPLRFSEKIKNELSKYGKKVEFFIYAGQKHEFIELWPLAAKRALQFFDKYVKDAAP